jgi:hypothetical protein
MPTSRYHLILLIFIGVVIYIVSCGSTSKIVFQYKTPANTIKFFVSENPNYSKGEGKLYARVDSGNVRIFYSFQPDNIFKTYNNLNNYIYSLSFNGQPVLKFTAMDSIVLSKADYLLDSLRYNDYKRSKNATGFDIEVAGH